MFKEVWKFNEEWLPASTCPCCAGGEDAYRYTFISCEKDGHVVNVLYTGGTLYYSEDVYEAVWTHRAGMYVGDVLDITDMYSEDIAVWCKQQLDKDGVVIEIIKEE